MKLLLFSDLHLHAFKDHSETRDDGINSRLKDGLEVLDRVREYAVANQIEWVLFGGDLFHKRQVLSVQTFNLASDAIRRFKRDGLKLILLRGNHDMANRDGSVHSLHSLRGVAKVVSEPESIELEKGVWVTCVPYYDRAEQTLMGLDRRPAGAEYHLGLCHAGVNGASTGPFEYQPLEQLKPDDLPMERYDFLWFGHYHKRQQIGDHKRAWYIGSPMQIARGEQGSKKGFIVFDTEKSWQPVPLGMPRFVTLPEQTIRDKPANAWDVEGNFVDVISSEEQDEGAKERISILLRSQGARSVHVSSAPARRTVGVMKRLDIDPSMDVEAMVATYIDRYGGKLDKAELKRMALEMLERADQEA